MEKLTRREFLVKGAIGLPACLFLPPDLFAANLNPGIFKNDAPEKLWKWSKEAMFYKKFNKNWVRCLTCPNMCVLSPGDRSVCRSKVNIDGTLYSLAYGNPCAVHIDPVEKKPLFHFRPGSRVFSIAATGCNFRCLNCQNWEISQARPEDVRFHDMFPEKVVEKAIASQSMAVAYTYSEAITFYEYMVDTAIAAKKKNISNLLISNGYILKKPLEHLCQFIDAANINLKSYSDKIYQKLNRGRLYPVLETFKTLHRENIHFEITTLVVPGYNDDDQMLKRMCDWILNNLGDSHPLHFLRFFPQYKLNRLKPTPVAVLERYRKTAMKMGINYTYLGNVPGHEGNHTFCHACKKLIVKRDGYKISQFNIKNSRCIFCNTRIPGIWS
jgi:pyruvate formate lyase activating enzyme